MASLFSSIKQAGLAIAKKVATVAGKFVFSAGRIIGELGSTLFSVTNILSYILKQENPPYKLIIFLPFAIANFFVNASIRVPSLIARFGKPHQPESEPIPLNLKGNAVYYGLTGIGWCSMLFASSKSYLDGITLLEFIISQAYGDAYKNSRLITNLIIAGAVALACSKGFSFYTYNLASIRDNSQKYAEKIQEGDWEWDRTMSLTLALSSLNLLGATLGGYFSMEKTTNKVPLLKDAPEKLKEAIAGFSASTAFISALTSSVPTLGARLEKYNNAQPDDVKKPEITSWWGTPLKVGTLLCGGVDTLREAVGNVPAMASTINTISKKFKKAGPDIIYHPAVITVAVLTAISSGVLSYTFGVLKGWDDLVKIWLNEQDDFEADYAYQPLPDNEFDAENPMLRSASIVIDGTFEPEESTAQSCPANLARAREQHAFFSLPDQDDIDSIQDHRRDIPLGHYSLPSHRRSRKEPTFDYSLNC